VSKNKLQRFAENKTFSNVFEPSFEIVNKNTFELKGNWNKEFFKNEHPIVLELGCGRGEYTVGLAQLYPEKNFIGIDIKGARLWHGANFALKNNIQNVAFVRTRIDFIESIFNINEVSEIWITFPDPQPSTAKEFKRLTSARFLNRYKNILTANGIIHLKTDNAGLYRYTLEVIKHYNLPLHFYTDNLYKLKDKENIHIKEAQAFKTYYEELFTAKGHVIHYICFGLKNENLIEEKLSHKIEKYGILNEQQ
jgi:tRNA (guanine-N7-)-methyltransferase